MSSKIYFAFIKEALMIGLLMMVLSVVACGSKKAAEQAGTALQSESFFSGKWGGDGSVASIRCPDPNEWERWRCPLPDTKRFFAGIIYFDAAGNFKEADNDCDGDHVTFDGEYLHSDLFDVDLKVDIYDANSFVIHYSENCTYKFNRVTW